MLTSVCCGWKDSAQGVDDRSKGRRVSMEKKRGGKQPSAAGESPHGGQRLGCCTSASRCGLPAAPEAAALPPPGLTRGKAGVLPDAIRFKTGCAYTGRAAKNESAANPLVPLLHSDIHEDAVVSRRCFKSLQQSRSLSFLCSSGGLTTNEQPVGVVKPAARNHFGEEITSFLFYLFFFSPE